MKITRIAVKARMVVPHPLLEFANIQREIELEAVPEKAEWNVDSVSGPVGILGKRASVLCTDAILQAIEGIQEERKREQQAERDKRKTQRIRDLREREADAADRIARLEAGEPEDDVPF